MQLSVHYEMLVKIQIKYLVPLPAPCQQLLYAVVKHIRLTCPSDTHKHTAREIVESELSGGHHVALHFLLVLP